MGFDGSSTKQAEGGCSDCMLKPVRHFPDPARKNGVLVLCEVMMPDGKTPHESNKRATILDDAGAWFGFEQEYFFYQNGRPLGFPEQGYPAPQGPYYTASATRTWATSPARSSWSTSTSASKPGINPEGINAEVAKGQWEFQILRQGLQEGRRRDCGWPATSCSALCEKYCIDVEYHCKPLGDTDWNGWACTATSRRANARSRLGKEYFESQMKPFEVNIEDHIAVYGRTTTCA